ncbi:MAG: ribokinase, partial [Cucumibacter sp.]
MSVAILGSLNMDIVLSVGHLPRPGETISGAKLAHFPGGKGSNQAIASARLGSPTSLIGAVGRDAFGETLLAYLNESGVRTDAVARLEGEATGQAFICVARDGENSIVVVPGANHAISPASVAGAAPGKHRVFLSQLEVPVEAVEAFFSSPAAKAGIRILNAAPSVVAARSLFGHPDYLIVNETELAAFAGAATPLDEPAEIARLARTLIARSGQAVVVTLGKMGAVAVTWQKLLEYAGYNVKVRDTT